MSPPALLAGLAVAGAVLLLLRPVPGLPEPSEPSAVAWPLVLPAVVGGGVALGSARVSVLILVGAAVLLAGRALLGVRRRRREASGTAARVLETCELLASEVASGRAPDVALRRAAEEWPALAPVAEAAGLGGDLSAGFAELARRPGAEDMRLVAAAWSVAHRTGGGLAEALDSVAGALRGRRAMRRVVESELSSARATARLVAALPLVMVLLGSSDGGHAWRFLVSSPVGVGCLVSGLAFGLVGLFWIERIADEVAA